jgi:hypothetical protein
MIRGYLCFCGQRPATLLFTFRTGVLISLGEYDSEGGFFGKKPHVGHFRIFGCHHWVTARPRNLIIFIFLQRGKWLSCEM